MALLHSRQSLNLPQHFRQPALLHRLLLLHQRLVESWFHQQVQLRLPSVRFILNFFVQSFKLTILSPATSSSEKTIGGIKAGYIIAISITGFVLVIALAAGVFWICVRCKRRTRRHRFYGDDHHDDEKGSRVALHSFGDRMFKGWEQKYGDERQSFSEHKVTVIPFLTESTLKSSDHADRGKGNRSFETSSTTLPDSPVEADLSLLPSSLPLPYDQDDIDSTLQNTSVRESKRPLSFPPVLLTGSIRHSNSPNSGLPYDLPASPSISNVAQGHLPYDHHQEDFDAEEEGLDGDSPSVYSQSSASVHFNMVPSSLYRGQSMMSHATGTFDLQPTIPESPLSESWMGGSDSHQHQQQLQRRESRRLERQSTTVIAGLIRSRQQVPKDVDMNTDSDASELHSRLSISAVSHIERAGSVRPPFFTGGGGGGGGVTDTATEKARATVEPYGRRFRRMAAEREAQLKL